MSSSLLRHVGRGRLPTFGEFASMLGPKRVTIDDFLTQLEASEFRLEFLSGTVLDFSGGTVAHGRLSVRITSMLEATAKAPGAAYSADMGVRIRDDAYLFPDASVSCEEVTLTQTQLRAPCLLVEVISPSSVQRDRAEKLDAYQSLTSVQEYLLIDSRRRWVGIHRRDGSRWIEESFTAEDARVTLTSVALSFTIGELYEGLAVLAS